MQAYAEGFELMYHSEFELDLSEIAGIWRYGSVVRSWLLELLHAAMEQHGDHLDDIAPYVEDSGEGRWTINEAINANVPVPAISCRALRPLRLAARDRLLGEGAGRAAQPVRRPCRQGRQGGEGAAVSEAENPLLEGLRLRRSAGPVRDRHLRRLRRPDPAQDLSGALLARVPPPAARAVRDRRRRAHGADDQAVGRRDEEGGQGARPRRAARGASGTSSRPGCATSPPTSPTIRARTTSSRRSASSTRSEGPRATASTTSPFRRPRSRRS